MEISTCLSRYFCVIKALCIFGSLRVRRPYSHTIDMQLKAVHVETFGKTGCRRIVPGQYLAADPQGRAIMISAVEKQKLVSVTMISMLVGMYRVVTISAGYSHDGMAHPW